MNQEKISLWLSRSLRAQAESQKFHLMMALAVALGNKESIEKFRNMSDKFSRAVPKLIDMAVRHGWNPKVMKDEKED